VKDKEFIRGNVPMTKEEIRSIVIGKLELQGGETLLDIGAGTGSVSIEAAQALPNGRVIALEQKEEAVQLIRQNCEKFGVKNLELVHAKAPMGLPDLSSINRVFIGGSGGNLEEILQMADEQMPLESIIVITAIVLDTWTQAYHFFNAKDNYEVELAQVSVNKVEKGANPNMLKAQNPIFIITAQKKSI